MALADIIQIVAPGSAVIGSRVDVKVKIQNKYPGSLDIMVGGALDYGVVPWPQITFPSNQANVPRSGTKSFNGYFTMPGKNTVIHAYSFYYSAEDFGWIPDDEMTWSIVATEEPTPPPPQPEWYNAAARYLYVGKKEAPVPQWLQVDRTRYLNVKKTEVPVPPPPPPPPEWFLAVTMYLNVRKAIAPPLVGWLHIATRQLMVRRPVAPPPPEEEVKFPWGVAAIVGGGAIALAAVAEAKKRKGLTKAR